MKCQGKVKHPVLRNEGQTKYNIEVLLTCQHYHIGYIIKQNCDLLKEICV